MWYVIKSVMKPKYWWTMLGLLFILVGQATCEILLPLSLTQLTQQAYYSLIDSFHNTAMNNVLYVALFQVALCVGFIICGVSSGIISSYLGSQICGDMRLKLYRKIQDLSFADLDNLKTSSLITRLTTDIEAIQNALFMIFRVGLRSMFLFLGGLVATIILAHDPSLTILPLQKPVAADLAGQNWAANSAEVNLMIMGLVMNQSTKTTDLWFLVPVILLAISAIMFGLLLSILIRSSRQYKITKYAIDDTNSVMRENILGVRVVKSFNLQENQVERFKNVNEKLRKTSEKSFIISMWMYPIINMSMSWAVILTIYVGVSSKAIDVANIGSIMSVTTLILFGMVLMINVILQYGIALGSCNRVREVLDKQPSIIFKENGLQIDKPVIKFENVNFKYNETGEYVLKDINLTINEDETIGIIGATGSGKSTFVSLITRMYDVKEGKLSISNIDIKDIDKHSLRNQISLSPQRVTLFSGTIASNLKYGKNDATLEEMKEAAKGAEAYEFIMQKPGEFNATVEQRGRNFSGGQQQRLSIARALIKKPKILILDSSTSALDMITEKKVNEYIKETNKGRTTIVISQRISGVRSADRILVFEKGKIAGVGSHIELLRNNPIYREIALSQLGKEGVESELGQR